MSRKPMVIVTVAGLGAPEPHQPQSEQAEAVVELIRVLQVYPCRSSRCIFEPEIQIEFTHWTRKMQFCMDCGDVRIFDDRFPDGFVMSYDRDLINPILNRILVAGGAEPHEGKH